MAKKVKITVLKRDLYKEFIEEYASDKSTPACNALEDGQVFYTDGLNKPDKFCSWAWADIHRDVVSVFTGGSFAWVNKPNTIISCCTDGFRPVTFKIEAVDE